MAVKESRVVLAGELTSAHVGASVQARTLAARVSGKITGVWHRKSYGRGHPKTTQVEISEGKNTFSFEMSPTDTLEVLD